MADGKGKDKAAKRQKFASGKQFELNLNIYAAVWGTKSNEKFLTSESNNQVTQKPKHFKILILNISLYAYGQ